MPKNTAKIWFVTGISSGFGQCLAEELISLGDFVVGTMRKPEAIESFNAQYHEKALALPMDINDHRQVKQSVAQVIAEYGRIDVLVNNAGYGLLGAIEEINEEASRQLMETNFFGPLLLTQTVLPFMRKAKRGCIVQMSSIAGICAMAGLGIYNASKFALEGFSEALALEVAPLGIKVMIVEPGPFRTKWAGINIRDTEKKIEDYATTAHVTVRGIHGYNGIQPGDPKKAAHLIIEAVNSSNPPLRLPLGKIAIDRIYLKLSQLKQDIDLWGKKSIATAFEDKN